jgi:iron complex outermembrane receptor protein
MHNRNTSVWLAAAAGLFIVTLSSRPQSAWAQAAPTLAAQADANSPEEIQEITVTAQFRKERLQDTPLAITAIDSATMEQKGLETIVDAANLAPNVTISPDVGDYGQIAAIFIRGVGQTSPHFAEEPGVGMYIDNVYYGVLSGALFSLMDSDRAEVLRGPQGTLSGKNSIGGSIKLFSKQPSDQDDAYVEGTYGDYNRIVARAASNFTLTDGLYARIAVASKHVDGYMKRLDYACATGNDSDPTYSLGRGSCEIGTQGGEDSHTARAAFRWIGTENLDNTLTFDVIEDRSENPPQKTIFQSPLWAGTNNYITCATCYTNYENYVVTPSGPNANPAYVMPDTTPLSESGVSNSLKYDFTSSLQLISITAYRQSVVAFASRNSATPASIADQLWQLSHKQFTQEFRLNGSVGTLMDWTAGLFYYDADGKSTGRITIDGGLAPGGGGLNLDFQLDDPVVTNSKSGFFHTVWHVMEKADLTAAVRYTSDTKEFTFNRLDIYGQPYAGIPLFDLPVTYRGDRTDYRFNLDYRWTRDFMTYVQIATGYKGGGVNPEPYYASQALPYNPETLINYEVGAKSAWFDRHFTLNATAFFDVYHNFQGALTSCPTISPFPDAPCDQVTNVGNAQIKGAELEAALNPVGGLTFDLAAGYLDFNYTKVQAATGVALGMTNVYTPKENVNAGVAYAIQLGRDETLTPRLDYNYRSSVQNDIVNTAFSTIGGRGLANASIAWRNPGQRLVVTLAVTNLTNKFYYVSLLDSSPPPFFASTGVTGTPREVMITVKKNL